MSESKPSKIEQELLDLIDAGRAMRARQNKAYEKKYGAKIRQLTEKIKTSGKCTHSSTVPYEWEWDSGYGKQKRIQGIECRLCGRKNSWGDKNGLWSRPEDMRRSGDDY